VVVGPALGGIILSQWTAYYLEKLSKKKVLSVYTEKNENFDQIFRRGYDVLVKDKNVMIVEDITTTGGSVQKVIKSVRKAGGIITAVEVMVSRDPDNVNSSTIGFPFSALDSIRVKQYQESQCPLCKKGIPINISIGHGNKFLAKKIV